MSTIAILWPGDMGAGVGAHLKGKGHDLVTCLAGRSEATRKRAERAGFRDLPDLPAVMRESELALSILPPSDAPAAARAVAEAMRAAAARPVFADCNAVSPATVRGIAETIAAAGAPFIDCGIIGFAPGKGTGATRFYVSGPDTAALRALDDEAIAVRDLGPEVGRASAMKMCYASLTKGTMTLYTAVLVAARALGLEAEMAAELQASQPAAWKAMQARVPRLPADAGRWIGEMEEIAATYREAGLPGGFHEAAAEIFRLLDRTPFAVETRETLDTSRTLQDAVRVYAAHLKQAAE